MILRNILLFFVLFFITNFIFYLFIFLLQIKQNFFLFYFITNKTKRKYNTNYVTHRSIRFRLIYCVTKRWL